MSKRLQIILDDEAWKLVEATTEEVNRDFNTGNVTYSHVVNEMILASKIDLKALQLKHVDLRRVLRIMADREDLDIEMVAKSVMELKSRNVKRSPKMSNLMQEAIE